MPRDEAAFAEAVEAMRETIRRDVAAGFRPDDDIAASAAEVECVEGVDPDELEGIARRLVREASAAHAREQATWPDRTDCDRLDDAFAELEERGIVARQDFSCCSNCGHGEMWGEVEEAREDGAEVRGYVFYHMQDTESAVEGGGLYLKYSVTDGGNPEAGALAAEVVQVLTARGLTTDWNGKADTCVHVSLDWKRRRPISLAAGD